MEDIPGTSTSEANVSGQQNVQIVPAEEMRKEAMNAFTCSVCSLHEQFDFKGTKPPFARQLSYLEECYIMKDPFSLPNKGEVLVLGADCYSCKKPVCLKCSVFYSKRFCQKCAFDKVKYFPSQMQTKIKGSIKTPSS